jgi:protease I
MKKLVIGIIIVGSIALISSPLMSMSQPTKDLEGKRILMIIAPSNFRDEELKIPKQVFEGKGAQVLIGSKGTKQAKGMLGMKVKPDLDIRDAKVSDWDAIIFVGGNGVEKHKLYEDEAYLKVAKDAYKEEKVIGAICLAPMILANAGILEGKDATAYHTAASYLKDHGAYYTGKAVEVNGRIVTAEGPRAAKEFAERIAELLT